MRRNGFRRRRRLTKRPQREPRLYNRRANEGRAWPGAAALGSIRGSVDKKNSDRSTMNIHQATTDYERWLRSHTRVIESNLKSKNQKMRSDLFLFLRGTFYRWAQLWPEVCADLDHAPKVIAVGDLHVNSFGTWRDAQGRMGWGVDDFDNR